MKNMTVERKKHLIILVMGILMLLILVVLFVVRYQAVNSEVRNQVQYKNTSYGKLYEIMGVAYEAQKPVWSKKYDKDYQMEVYQYRVSVAITNRERREVSIYDIVPSFCLLSGGNVWYGNVEECEKEILNTGDSLSIEMFFDVIPEENMESSMYETAELYHVVTEGKRTYKVEYQ